MTEKEKNEWIKITQDSAYCWTEDQITYRNGQGRLFYCGGEEGRYMRLHPDGKISIGSYTDAYPHIGEACFRPIASHRYSTPDEAFQAACQIGGLSFLRDLFSQVPQPSIGNDSVCPDSPTGKHGRRKAR